MHPREQMQDTTTGPGLPPVTAPMLPRWAEDPRPALAAGVIAFTAGIPVTWSLAGSAAMWTCAAGVVVGAAGWGVYTWQRAAVRRGVRWAQEGIRDDG